MNSLRVKYICPFATPTGYARAAQDYAMALHVAEVPFQILPILACDTDDLEPRYHSLVQHVEEFIPNPTHVIVHAPPFGAHDAVQDDMEPAPGVKRICLTTWETTYLPKEFAENLNKHFDLVIVPCEFNLRVFLACGVRNVVILPHAFDAHFWKFGEEPVNKPYTFYNVGGWGERKNPIGLLKAYLTEFTADDHVNLKMLVPWYFEQDVASLKLAIGLKNLPPVEFIVGRETEADLRKLHNTSHCFVTPTRGEGWGLGAFEAALSGNHVISTDWSGVKDFLDPYKNKQLLKYTMTPVVSPEPKLTEPVVVGNFRVEPGEHPFLYGYSSKGSWAEPDLAHCKHAMRHAYEHKIGKDIDAAEEIRAKFNLYIVGKQFKNILERM